MRATRVLTAACASLALGVCIGLSAKDKLPGFEILQGKPPKEIHVVLKGTLGEHTPSYTTVKNWVAQFKRGDFSTCDAPRPEPHEVVTAPEIVDQIHGLILEDRRISDKSVDKQLGISMSGLGP